jgi:thiamine biosynthesis lipoprotein
MEAMRTSAKQNRRIAAAAASVFALGFVAFVLWRGSGTIDAAQGYLMGSIVNITTVRNPLKKSPTADSLLQQFEAVGRKCEELWNNSPASDTELTAFARQIAEETDGAFHPGLKALINLWNIESKDGSPPYVPTASEIQAALTLCDWTDDSALHFGAIGKGAMLDTAAAFQTDNPLSFPESMLLDFGGNILSLGSKTLGKPWRVALRDPQGGGSAGIFTLSGRYFISTSGGYEKYFIQNGISYHHIFDSRTGCPAETGNLLSVSVVTSGQDHAGALGDALSTAAFVLGYAKAIPILEAHDCAAVFLYKDGSARAVGTVRQILTLTESYRWYK